MQKLMLGWHSLPVVGQVQNPAPRRPIASSGGSSMCLPFLLIAACALVPMSQRHKVEMDQ